MKTNRFLAMTAGSLLWVGIASAQVSETNITFLVNQTIPDANAAGLTLPQNLTLLPGAISDVKVSLDITGGFNGDLYAYLAGPGGGFAVLLNRVGVSNNASVFGYSDAGLNATFSDAAANGNIHYYQNVITPMGGQLLGTWQPDGINIDPRSTPSAFLGAGQAAMLSSLNGLNPNGPWTLFLADLSAGSQSTVVSWGLDITTTVPEPQSLALLGLATLFFSWRRQSRQTA
jgi:subtilisin-like proprotein convertase family protein